VIKDLVKQAWRSATARRGHAALVAGAIAAGIAANAVVFAVVDGAILRPFPYPDAERLVGIGAAYPRLNRGLEFFEALSGPEYQAIKEGVPALDRLTAFDLGNEPVMLGNTPERVFTAYFFDDPFQVLAISPAAGRSFSGDELATGAPVALITHRLAASMSDDPAALVGSALRVGGRPHTIIGIVPPRVDLYDTGLWIPMTAAAASLPQNRRQFNALGRLAEGGTLEAANLQLGEVASRIARDHRAAHAEYEGFRLQGRGWTEVHAWGMSNIALVCFVGVGLLLVLIIANLANLLLASAAARSREMAVRTALGAGRGRLAVQVLLEMLLLAAVGAAAGLLLADLGLRMVLAGLGDVLPPGVTLALSGRLVGFVALLSVLTGLVVSLAPVLQFSRVEPASILTAESGRTSGSRRTRRLQRTIVAVEVAIALVVTGSALLLAGAISRVLAVDPGFPHDNVLVMRITLPLPKYEGARAMAFFDALVERVRDLPAVAEVSLSNQPPPGLFSRAQFAIDGQPAADRLPSAFFTTAGPGYAETLGLQLARGRWFDDRAGRDGVREVVINESAAQRFFPGEDPLGRRLLITPPHSDNRPTEIVGVVRAIRNRGLVLEPGPEIIGSVRQIPDRRQSQLYVVVRGQSGTATLLDGVRGVIAGIDPEQPVYGVSTLSAQYEAGIAGRRATATLLSIFAAFALGLACLGIYGVMSQTVSSRTREIGIRAALGAERGALRRMVIGDAMRPVAGGLLLGTAALVAGQKTLASWIYGVTLEAAPLVATCLVLVCIGLVASVIPALRASRIRPTEALRQ
jgi:putative ABC transport system permease protein